MKKVIILLILTTLMILTACNRKRRTGVFQYSGKIVDAYDNQGIDSLLVFIANEERNGMYRPFLSRLSAYDTTNADGQFSLETGREDDTRPFLVIAANKINQYTKIEDIYEPSQELFEFDEDRERVFTKRYMERDIYSNELIRLKRYGTLRINIIKNPTIISDDIIIGYERQNAFNITSDTTLFVQTKPDAVNQFTCKRGETIIWSQDFTIGLKGDTISTNIQL